MTLIIYSKDFLLHDNAYHPEKAERLTAIMNFLKETSFYDQLHFLEPFPLNEKDLKKIHTPHMINQVKEGAGWLDSDTYLSPKSFNIACKAAGGVVQACQHVMDGDDTCAFSLNRPPGHHATKSRSMGFCLFNNVALAADAMAAEGYRILIFDHDVHHGNGTSEIFFDRDDVLYQSFHLSPHYPGTGGENEIGYEKGEGYTVNAPLPYGVGNKGIRQLLEKIMLPIAKQFSPDLIIFSAGFDSHHSDPLGGLMLTTDFFGAMIKLFRKTTNRIVCSLEGGYNLESLKKSVITQISELNGTPFGIEDTVSEGPDISHLIGMVREIHRDHWSL